MMMPLALGFLLAASSLAHIPPCLPIPAADAVIDRPDVRWIVAGEMHGTAEMPSAFGDLVCAAAGHQRKVVVALEHPVSEQMQIDEYLSSDGDAAARARLTSASIWHRKTADGRTSEAFLSLFERLRMMKKSGQISGVVAFQPDDKPLAPADYEKEMARVVEAASASPDVLVVALVGNIHARTAEWSRAEGERYMPMAGLLPREQTETLSMSGNGGTAWNCPVPHAADPKPTFVCGAHPLGGTGRIYARGVKLIDDPSAPYFAYFNIGTALSASPPAVN